jgi:hypothetical protein
MLLRESEHPPHSGPRSGGESAMSPVLIGIVVSAGLATLLALVTSTTVLLGVCAALLGTLLGVVYDLHRRFERRVEAEDHRSALLAALDDAPWLLKELREIATNAKGALAEGRNRQLFEDLMREKVGETKAYMQDLKRGHIRVPAGDLTPMSNQIDLVKETVLATTIPEIDNGWWLSPAGRDYLRRNHEAIKRGVIIQRIVLWDEVSQALAQVVAEQKAAEVEVFFAQRSKVPDKKLRTNMAIYDSQSYNDVVFNSDGDGIYFEFYLDPRDAKQAVARFEQLMGFATKEVPKELAQWRTSPDV